MTKKSQVDEKSLSEEHSTAKYQISVAEIRKKNSMKFWRDVFVFIVLIKCRLNLPGWDITKTP